MVETKEQYMIIQNPYVVQIDKFAESIKKLSNTFLKMEGSKETFTYEEIEEIYLKVRKAVCSSCDRCSRCENDQNIQTHQLVYELLRCVEEYGVELNVETKRRLQKKCIQAPRFLRETLEAFQNAKEEMMWNNKMVQSREGYARQLSLFAGMLQNTAREMDASIYRDDRLERKIKNRLRKIGIKLFGCIFFINEEGKYEVHLTIKSLKDQCVTTKEIASVISSCAGKRLVLTAGERPLIGQEYCAIALMENPAFYTLNGAAKIGKGCEQISGDNFLMMEIPGGKEGAILSDGMGSGDKAFRESARVVEMLEELLAAGFPYKEALQLMNSALVIGREEIRFSTIDMSVFDLYEGSCEFVKVGASTTFIKYDDHVEKIASASLPVGVLQNIEFETVRRKLNDGNMIVMVTDGVMDALPVGEAEFLMETIVQGTNINNPKEMAHHILEQVLKLGGEIPLDDMTVLVIGIWRA